VGKPEKPELAEVLEKFKKRRSYQELDRKALEISRKAASGSMGEGQYADWALISNDALVIINSVKTFITLLSARFSSNPFRPKDDDLNELGINSRLNSLFTKIYEDVLTDGYAYASIGFEGGKPVVKPVDARYIMFNGDSPTLDDATDVIIFNLVPKPMDEPETNIAFPEGFVEFEKQNEKVEAFYYSKDDEGVHLDIYKDEGQPESSVDIPLTKIPVVRFVGDETELEDKRAHYRGLYHLTASIIKAMTLAATKIQIQTAMMDDDNYIVPQDAISNNFNMWQNAGVKIYSSKDGNGMEISPPAPIQKNPQFLIEAFSTWQSVLSSMLGNIVQSSSEAVTREEVIARNEIRDAITNSYLTKMSDSISRIYSLIKEFSDYAKTRLIQPAEPVVIQGGYLEQVKREKQKAELMGIYQLAKESGLNTQGFSYELLGLADLDVDVKERIRQTFSADPNASPALQAEKAKAAQLEQALQQKEQHIAILRTQASQRLERQSEYVAMVERTKRMELAFKQWQQETKDAQQARLEFMKSALAQGNIEQALKAMDAMERRDSLVLAQTEVQDMINSNNQAYGTASEQVAEAAQQAPQQMPQEGG
jgi:hypothetical protein